MIKVGVITGTRAEYGLLKNLMKSLECSEKFLMYVLVTGSHLSEEFGEKRSVKLLTMGLKLISKLI